jgi:hypothetical protein
VLWADSTSSLPGYICSVHNAHNDGLTFAVVAVGGEQRFLEHCLAYSAEPVAHINVQREVI